VVNSAVPEVVPFADLQDGDVEQAVGREVHRGRIVPVHPLLGRRGRIVLAPEVHEAER
jgi:hypothetical protein